MAIVWESVPLRPRLRCPIQNSYWCHGINLKLPKVTKSQGNFARAFEAYSKYHRDLLLRILNRSTGNYAHKQDCGKTQIIIQRDYLNICLGDAFASNVSVCMKWNCVQPLTISTPWVSDKYRGPDTPGIITARKKLFPRGRNHFRQEEVVSVRKKTFLAEIIPSSRRWFLAYRCTCPFGIRSLVPHLIGPPSHWSPSHWSPNSLVPQYFIGAH